MPLVIRHLQAWIIREMENGFRFRDERGINARLRAIAGTWNYARLD